VTHPDTLVPSALHAKLDQFRVPAFEQSTQFTPIFVEAKIFPFVTAANKTVPQELDMMDDQFLEPAEERSFQVTPVSVDT
jgi:hypothetical protein